jgi:hypothetical protein
MPALCAVKASAVALYGDIAQYLTDCPEELKQSAFTACEHIRILLQDLSYMSCPSETSQEPQEQILVLRDRRPASSVVYTFTAPDLTIEPPPAPEEPVV